MSSLKNLFPLCQSPKRNRTFSNLPLEALGISIAWIKVGLTNIDQRNSWPLGTILGTGDTLFWKPLAVFKGDKSAQCRVWSEWQYNSSDVLTGFFFKHCIFSLCLIPAQAAGTSHTYCHRGGCDPTESGLHGVFPVWVYKAQSPREQAELKYLRVEEREGRPVPSHWQCNWRHGFDP